MAGLGPLPSAHSRFSEGRGLTYHVATPPLGGDDANAYIAGRENAICTAAMRYGGSAVVHSQRLAPRLPHALHAALDGRPRSSRYNGASPPLNERQPEQRIAGFLCGAGKTLSATLRASDQTWFQRPLDTRRPTSSAQMANWHSSHRVRVPGHRAAPSFAPAPATQTPRTALSARAAPQRVTTRSRSHHAHGDTYVEDF